MFLFVYCSILLSLPIWDFKLFIKPAINNKTTNYSETNDSSKSLWSWTQNRSSISIELELN